jgi:ankyrin repeat protein
MKILFPLFCCLPFLLTAQDEAPSSKELLRTGLFEEEVNQDHKKAEAAYRKVTERYDQERYFAGLAFFRLAEIARKSGNEEKANTLYLRVAGEFSDQKEIAQRALAQLGDKAPLLEQPNLKLLITEEEAQELKRLKKIERESPDLLDGMGKDGWYPIHTAAANGWTKALEFLMERKVQIDPKTSGKVKSTTPHLVRGPSYTPLQLAVINGHLAVVDQLISYGTNTSEAVYLVPGEDVSLPVTAPFTIRRLRGAWSPLDLSILLERKEIMTRLLKSKNDLNSGNLQLEAVTTATEGARNRRSWQFKITPLILAIWMNNSEAVDALIAHGADLNHVEEKDGGTPLLFAIWKDSPLIPSLIDKGAKISNDPIFGRSAFQWAIAKCGTRNILRLLQKKPDVNIRVFLNEGPDHDKAKLTPLEAILERKSFDVQEREEICAALLKEGAQPTARALLKATAYGFTKIVAYCIDSGLDPNESDKDGNHPLHFTDKLEIAKILVTAGAKVNAKNGDGFNPLINATLRSDTDGSRALIDYLLKQGTDSSVIPKLLSSHPEIGESPLLPYLMSKTLLVGKTNPKAIMLACPYFWKVTAGEDLILPGSKAPSLKEFLNLNSEYLNDHRNRRVRDSHFQNRLIPGRSPTEVVTDLIIYRPDQNGRLEEIAQLDEPSKVDAPSPKLEWGDIVLFRYGPREADKQQMDFWGHLTGLEPLTITFKVGPWEHQVTMEESDLALCDLDLRAHFLSNNHSSQNHPFDLTKITLRRANGESKTIDLTNTEDPKKIRLIDGDVIDYTLNEQQFFSGFSPNDPGPRPSEYPPAYFFFQIDPGKAGISASRSPPLFPSASTDLSSPEDAIFQESRF